MSRALIISTALVMVLASDATWAQKPQGEKHVSRQTPPGPAAAAHDQNLDGDQALYARYAEGRWSAFLNRRLYDYLPPDGSRKEVEAYWFQKLQAPGITLPPPMGEGFDGYPSAYLERFEAINILAALKSKRAVDTLLAIATVNVSKDNRDRWMAVRALGLIEESSVIPKLIPLIYYPNPNTRLWAQITLVRLTGENHGYDPDAWGKWWNSSGGQPRFEGKRVVWNLDTVADASEREKLRDPAAQKEDDQDFLSVLRGIFNNPRF